MAEVKISQLTDASTLNGFYTVGSKEENGTLISCKYNLGNLSDKFQSGVDGLVNTNNCKPFDVNRKYFTGNLCLYNNKTYKFVKTHFKGAWNMNDVVETDVIDEINAITSGTHEELHINISSSDAQLAVLGKTVTITFSDNSSPIYLTTDSNGNCETYIEKGKIYSVSVTEQSGYQKPADIIETTASQGIRYINLVYTAGAVSTATITVTLNMNGGIATAYDGSAVTLLLDNKTALSATFTSGVATFQNVAWGVNGTLIMPIVEGYRKPRDKYISVNDTSVNVTLDVNAVNAFGIFYVDSRDWNEYLIEDYPMEDASYLVSLHINTKTLAESADDYYVRVSDLCGDLQSKQWCSSTILLPNVSRDITYKSGVLQTYNMLKDSSDLYVISPAAAYASEQIYINDNKRCLGFIGSRTQYDIILKDSSYEIATNLSSLGYTANYVSKYIWSSIQYSNNNITVWNWRNGWNSYDAKTASFYILPLFSAT